MRLASTSRFALFHRIAASFFVAILFFTNSAVALANFSASILAFASVLSSTSAAVRIAPPENVAAVSPASAATISWKASPHAVSGSVDSYRIYIKPSSKPTYSACPASAAEKNLNKNCSVEYSFSTDATETFSLTINLKPDSYDFLVRTVANASNADFDSSIHESKTDCASCEIKNFSVTAEDETAPAPTPTPTPVAGGGGGGGSSIGAPEPTHAAAPKATVTKTSETATEINFSINLNSTQKTEAQLGIASLQKNAAVDERLIEIGQLDENAIWKSFTKTEIKPESTSIEVQKSGVVTAKIIDAEILAKAVGAKIETTKAILPTIGGEIPVAVKFKNPAAQVEIPAQAKVREANETIFNRVIHPPQVVSAPPSGSGGGGGGVQIESAVSVGSSSGSITFDQPVLISLPIQNLKNSKLLFFDENSEEWLMTEDSKTGKLGGKISADGKTISAFVSHFTIFAVAGVAEDQLAEMEDKSKGWKPAMGKLFRDLSESHWSHDFVINLKDRGIIAGYPDQTFRPNNSINRAELTKIAVEAFLPAENSTDQGSKFPDVAAGSWFEKFVVTAENSKIVAGYPDGSFRPGDSVNRAEALKILIGAAGFATDSVESEFSDIASTDWFAPFVAWSEKKGVVGGYPLEFGEYEFPRNLQFGSNGEDVGVLQFLLREMGFYAGKTSFYFGNLTVGSLAKFQEKNLTAGSFRAGVLDEITKNKIYELTDINRSRVIYEFRPANLITRAEVAKIVSILLDLKNKGFSLDSQIHSPASREKPRFDLSKIEFENPLSISTPAKKPEVFTPNSLFEKLRKIF